MEQLNGLDAFFVHGESSRTPMHIGALLVYTEPRKVHPDIRYQQLRERVVQALPSAAVFRRRLLKVPAGLDHPYWIEDADFNLDNHLQRHRLRSKASYYDLEKLVASLHANQLDFSRPLWEAHLIEGLGQLAEYPSNSYGLYLKVHHAALDGVSATQILNSIHDATVGEQATPDTWEGERPPSSSRLLWRAYLNSLRQPLALIGQGQKLLPRWQRSQSEAKASPDNDSHRIDPGWQRSPFNKAVEANRQLTSVHFEMDALQRLRHHQTGATINHVLLAIISGAVRRYLIHLNQLPDTPLGAMVPVNLRSDDSGNSGNMIGAMIAGLRVDIDDPLQRLQAAATSAMTAKKSAERLGRFSMMNVARNLPSLAERSMFWSLAAMCRLPGGLPMPVATVLSNIPGPTSTMHLNGTRLIDIQAIGLLTDGCGLFHVAFSYQGRLSLTALSSSNTLVDPQRYRQCLLQSFDELLEAVEEVEDGA